MSLSKSPTSSGESLASAESDDNLDLIQWFRKAMPYINAHRGKTFVIMISGAGVAQSNLRNIVHDIVLLNTLGVKLIIVHGVRQQLDEKLVQYGIASEFVDGKRVTTKQILDAAIQSCSLVRSALETQLSTGLPNSPMHGAKVRVASVNAISAKPAGVIEGIDLQHTGVVRKIDTQTINTLLTTGNIVLLSPIGYSPSGDAFSLPYQHVAAEIAIAVKADKLISFVDADGIYREGELLHEVTPQTALTISDPDANDTDLARSVAAVCHAVNNGIERGHIMNYTLDGALLEELFSVDGKGTLIQQQRFENLRTATAADVPAIIDIIEPLERRGVLVKRDRASLSAEIHYFTVIEREEFIIALAALYPYTDSQCGEIACITTHPDYQGSSRGKSLLAEMEHQAKQLGLTSVFVLTTQTTHWFIENGFKLGSIDDLPEQKKSLYNYQRNAKVLVKKLV